MKILISGALDWLPECQLTFFSGLTSELKDNMRKFCSINYLKYCNRSVSAVGTLKESHSFILALFTFHFHALEKEMATRSSVLAWRIPGTGEPGGLPSLGSHRVRHD